MAIQEMWNLEFTKDDFKGVSYPSKEQELLVQAAAMFLPERYTLEMAYTAHVCVAFDYYERKPRDYTQEYKDKIYSAMEANKSECLRVLKNPVSLFSENGKMGAAMKEMLEG